VRVRVRDPAGAGAGADAGAGAVAGPAGAGEGEGGCLLLLLFLECAYSELDRFGAVVYDLSLDLGYLDEFSAKVSRMSQGQGRVCRGQMYTRAQNTHHGISSLVQQASTGSMTFNFD
jgi:hypothetical protein